MKEYTKIYDTTLLYNKILHLENKINNYDYNKYKIILDKKDDTIWVMTLYKNNVLLFKVANSLDCLYCLLDGYYKALFDNELI